MKRRGLRAALFGALLLGTLAGGVPAWAEG